MGANSGGGYPEAGNLEGGGMTSDERDELTENGGPTRGSSRFRRTGQRFALPMTLPAQLDYEQIASEFLTELARIMRRGDGFGGFLEVFL